MIYKSQYGQHPKGMIYKFEVEIKARIEVLAPTEEQALARASFDFERGYLDAGQASFEVSDVSDVAPVTPDEKAGE